MTSDDKKALLRQLKTNSFLFTNVSPDLKNDKNFVLEAIRANSHILQYVNADFKKDKEVVLAAVKKDGITLQYAHDDLKKDKEIVLEAVRNQGFAYQFAHVDLRRDREVFIAVVKKNSDALYYNTAPDIDFTNFGELFHRLKENRNLRVYPEIKEKIDKILARCEELFINEKLPVIQLVKVLRKTNEFIQGPLNRYVAFDYNQFVSNAIKSPWAGMQLLGKLMMALATVMVGATMATAGVGFGVGVVSFGLFASGTYLMNQEKNSEKALILELSLP